MILLEDDYKKESKRPATLFVACLFVTVMTALSNVILPNDEFSTLELVLTSCFFGAFTLYMLYRWLETLRYKLVVTNKKITARTLFKKYEIEMVEITKCTYQQYKKTELYQFGIYGKESAFSVTTRYQYRLVKILEKHEISVTEVEEGGKL
ncbi:MAG: hypothetical protein ACOX5X_04080 [Acholeplasmataceae bacterium]|jgi:hypothetical protein